VTAFEAAPLIKPPALRGVSDSYQAAVVKRADGCTTGAEWPSE